MRSGDETNHCLTAILIYVVQCPQMVTEGPWCPHFKALLGFTTASQYNPDTGHQGTHIVNY